MARIARNQYPAGSGYSAEPLIPEVSRMAGRIVTRGRRTKDPALVACHDNSADAISLS